MTLPQDLPASTPRWSNNPPASPPVTVTAPSEAEKDQGYQPGNPRRQHTNWLFREFGSWVEWFRSKIFRTSDAWGDQALPGGTPPGLGAGLTISPGSFSARVYAAGYGVELTSGPDRQEQIFLIPAAPNNTTLYRIIINGVNCDYTTDGSATQAELRDNMFAAINAAVGADVTASADGVNVRVVQDNAGVPFTFSIATGPSQPITLGSSSPNYVYSANSDTYWDLHRSGGWVPVIVASGAGAPALTTNATRVYRVRTDATDRTTLVDFRRDRVVMRNDIDNSGNIRHTTETISKSVGGTSPFGEMSAPRMTDTVDELGAGAQLLRLLNGANALITGAYVYSNIVGGLSCGWTIAFGAHLSAASTWIADQTEAFRLDFAPNGSTRGLQFKRKTGLTIGVTTWADSAWNDELAANTVRLQLPLGFGLKLGGDEMGQLDGDDANLTPLLEYVRNVGGAVRTLLSADLTAASESIVEYISTDGETAYERVYNAKWDDAAAEWVRTLAGTSSWRLYLGPSGPQLDYHSSGGAASWASWDLLVSVIGGSQIALSPSIDLAVGGSLSVVGNVTSLGHVVLSEYDATPAAHALYDVAIPKALGSINTDGAGNITLGATGFGYTATIDATKMRIVFTNAWDTGHLENLVVTPTLANSGGAADVVKWDYVNATTIDLYFYTDAGVAVNPLTNVVQVCFAAFGRQA